MSNSTKKQELNNAEREQFLLHIILSFKLCSVKDIEIEYAKKEIRVTKNTIYNDINALVESNFVKKIGKSSFKLECSEVIRDIKDLIKKRNYLEYNELIDIDFQVNNLKQIVKALIDVKVLEKVRDSINKFIVKLKKKDAN